MSASLIRSGTLALALTSTLLLSAPGAAQPNVKTLNRDTPGQVFRVEDFLQSKGRQMVVLVSEQSSACQRFQQLLEPLARSAGVSICYLLVDRPGSQEIDWRSPLLQQFQVHALPYPILYNGREKLDEGAPVRKWLLELQDK